MSNKDEKLNLLKELLKELFFEEKNSEIKEDITSKDFKEWPNTSLYINEWVLVRTYSAGVYYGILKKCYGEYILLEKARMIYEWTGEALCVVELANQGPRDVKLSQHAETPIEISNAITILPLSKRALQKYEETESFCKETN